MSERDQINEMFDRLASDVGDHTRPPGASRAIRAAGRRRQSFVAAAAVCVLAGGGIAVNAITGDDSDGRDQRPSGQTEPVPVLEPQEITADAADRATRGWADGWSGSTTPVLTDPPCLSGAGLDRLDPAPLGDQVDLGIAEDVGLSSFTVEMPDSITGREVFNRLTGAVEDCARAPQTTAEFTLSDTDLGSFASWSKVEGDPAVSLWVVQHEQVITLVVVAGDLGSPSTTVQRDMLALADATLHWNADHPGDLGDSGDSGGPGSTPADPTSISFDTATAGWVQGWRSGFLEPIEPPRCVATADLSDLEVRMDPDREIFLTKAGTAGMRLASSRLPSLDEARQILTRMTNAIRDCGTPPRTLTETRLTDGARVTFAAYAAIGKRPASRAWIVQRGGWSRF